MLLSDPRRQCSLFGPQGPVSISCPKCRHIGSFESLNGLNDVSYHHSVDEGSAGKKTEVLFLGHRFCPNPNCRAHVFIVARADDKRILVSYPAIRIDFDSTAIPGKILRTFEEALTCHASGCFTAAAIMVRKTIEELCEEQGAKEGTLKSRLVKLREKVILPVDLMNAVDNIRLLGNDAAHIELQNFSDVGQREVELVIKLTKEILKAIYQYGELRQEIEALKTRRESPN